MAISSVKWVNDSLVISAFPDISISEVTDFRIKVGSCSRACDNKFRNSVVAESQTSWHGSQVGTGKGPERCFDLFSRVCFHGCNRAFWWIGVLRTETGDDRSDRAGPWGRHKRKLWNKRRRMRALSLEESSLWENHLSLPDGGCPKCRMFLSWMMPCATSPLILLPDHSRLFAILPTIEVLNGTPLDAEISRNIIYGKPPVCVRQRTGRSVFH